MTTGWKFLEMQCGKIVSNYDKSLWEIGKWRNESPPAEECKGLNCSNLIPHALSFVAGGVLARVEYDGRCISSDKKITCERMRILEAWAWTKKESVALAIFSAEQVLHNFEDQIRNCLGAPAADALFYRRAMAPKKHGEIFVWRGGKSREDFARIQARKWASGGC